MKPMPSPALAAMHAADQARGIHPFTLERPSVIGATPSQRNAPKRTPAKRPRWHKRQVIGR